MDAKTGISWAPCLHLPQILLRFEEESPSPNQKNEVVLVNKNFFFVCEPEKFPSPRNGHGGKKIDQETHIFMVWGLETPTQQILGQTEARCSSYASFGVHFWPFWPTSENLRGPKQGLNGSFAWPTFGPRFFFCQKWPQNLQFAPIAPILFPQLRRVSQL